MVLRDLYILNNRKKVFYKSNHGGADPLKMNFSAAVPLEEGPNIIRVIARENDKFVGVKTVIVYRQRTDKSAGENFEAREMDYEME